MKEIKLRKDTGMKLLGKRELYKVLDTTLQFSPERAMTVEFVYNVDVNSLSINFIQNEEKIFWYLFQDERLNKARLKKLKDNITANYELS